MDRQAHTLITQLRKDCPIRKAAEAILVHQPLDPEVGQVLLATIATRAGKQWEKQVVAIWLLSQMQHSPTERVAIASRLRGILADRPSRSIVWMLIWCSFYFVGLPWIMLTSYLDGKKNRVRAAASSALASLGTSSAEEVRASAEALANATLEVPRRTSSGDKSVRIASTLALPAILRSVKAAHELALPPKIVHTLCRIMLEPNVDSELACIEALKLISDPKALGELEKVRDKHKSALVRAAATQACEALNLAKSHAALLRPASAPGEDVNILLRPASVGSETPAEQLLRPAEYGTSESE